MGGVLRDIVRNARAKKEDPTAIKVASLTRREHEVIGLISKGLKNREIGTRLFISETTVRHHLTSVFEKLGVSNRLELIIFAFSQGLASLPENDQSHGNRGGQSSGVQWSPPCRIENLFSELTRPVVNQPSLTAG
jgi:DNA-binding CsgD family transcriptional regulator